MNNIYDGFTFVKGLSLKDTSGTYMLGKGDDYTADFYGLEKREGVNFPKLLAFLKANRKPKLYYGHYRGTSIKERVSYARYGVVKTGRTLDKTIPFTYINEYKQEIETSINCGINKREDYILGIPHFSLDVDYKSKKLVCRLVYFYENTEKYRISDSKTQSKDGFTIQEKYVAVKFFSENISDMTFLTQEVYGRSDWYRNNVNEIYIPLLENAKNNEELIWLYENAADFTLNALPQEILWKHIQSFYNYDTTGRFSYFKDASLPLIRALFAFNTQEKISYLMEQFHKDQSFIKKIYDALDGTMIYEGKEQKLQTIFASILTGFCFADISTLYFTNEVFYIGKDYYVNVEEVDGKDKEQEKYGVEQRHKTDTYYIDTGTAVVEMGGENILVSKTKMNPLDVVTLLQKDTDSLLFVPVIFLKDIDHQKDIAETLTAIRVGVDFLAIALTISTLGGASPLLAVAGALEIGLAVTDIAVMTNKDQFSKEFLDTWEKVYVIGGLATASPVAVASLYKLGGKILASSAKAEIKNFVQSCIVKILLEREISNFSKKTVKVLTTYAEISTATNGVITESKAKLLYKYGVFIIEGEFKTGKTITKETALIYKGEIITHADRYKFFEKANPLLKNLDNEQEFIKLADELLVYGKEYPVSTLKPLVTEAEALAKFGEPGKTIVKVVDNKVQNILQTFSDDEIKEMVMVSGMIYRKGTITKYFTATNFLKQEIAKGKGKAYLDFLKDLHPTLKTRLEKHIGKNKLKNILATKNDIDRAGIMASHGEIRALDSLLKEIDPKGVLGESVFQDIIGYNRFLREGAQTIQPPCVHCFYLTSGVKFVGF